MDDNLPKGGRGLKAPYETCVMRVPRPCEKRIWEIVDEYRETGEVPDAPDKMMGAIEAWDKARIIYQSKMGRTKSAKASLEKLLQDIYGVEMEL